MLLHLTLFLVQRLPDCAEGWQAYKIRAIVLYIFDSCS